MRAFWAHNPTENGLGITVNHAYADLEITIYLLLLPPLIMRWKTFHQYSFTIKKHWLAYLCVIIAGAYLDHGNWCYFDNPDMAQHVSWVLSAYGLADFVDYSKVKDIPF